MSGRGELTVCQGIAFTQWFAASWIAYMQLVLALFSTRDKALAYAFCAGSCPLNRSSPAV